MSGENIGNKSIGHGAREWYSYLHAKIRPIDPEFPLLVPVYGCVRSFSPLPHGNGQKHNPGSKYRCLPKGSLQRDGKEDEN